MRCISTHTWKEAREPMQAVRPELALILDAIDPPEDYTFIRVRYPFGSKILDQHRLALPEEGADTQAIYKALSYAAMPLGLVMNHAIEHFANINGRVVPFQLLKAGTLLGACDMRPSPRRISIDRLWPWSITAGARSLFMLPKISDYKSHLKLQQALDIHSFAPRNVFEHWPIFKEIAQRLAPDWAVDILFFSEEWMKPHKNNVAWHQFSVFCAEEAIRQSLHWRNKLSFDFSVNLFNKAIERRALKPNRYQMNTVRHLIELGCGTLPGFIPAIETGDNSVAPIACIQNAYQEMYGLTRYAPLMLQPHHLSLEDSIDSVYYSLHTPTLLESPAKGYQKSSVMGELKALKIILALYLNVLNEQPNLPHSEDINLTHRIEYHYLHYRKDPSHIIEPVLSVIKKDVIWKQAMNIYANLEFPNAAPFLRGCIQTKRIQPI